MANVNDFQAPSRQAKKSKGSQDSYEYGVERPHTLYNPNYPPSKIHLKPSPAHTQLVDDEIRQIHNAAYLSGMVPEAEHSLRYVNSDKDLSLPLDNDKALYDTQAEEISIRKYLGIGVQWVSLVTENLLSHPFVVLRRQCQVYNASTRYHLHPIYLIPSIVHLHGRQGITTLWKGLGSCLMVRGISLAIEDFLTKVTPWPKEVDSNTTMKRFGQHLLLKCISIVIVVPFYAASLVETVQSDIASEKPGLFDVFREGTLRLLYWRMPQKGRMLPVWALIGPVVTVGLAKYLFGLIFKGLSTRIMQRRMIKEQVRKGAKCKDDALQNQNIVVYSNLISMLMTEMIFYPFETVLHRIQLQGTRTIIDNLDNGKAVVPILTSYQSATDCYRTTVATEGYWGLYKGFGALILQFAAHVVVIKITKWVVTQISEVIINRPSTKVMQYYNNLNRPERSSNSTTTISSNISSTSEPDLASLGKGSVD